jgi:GNAT superfamily N-acetyltransferase
LDSADSVLAFLPFAQHEPGSIAGLLLDCYAALLQQLPAEKSAELRRDWREYDEAIFEEPETIGASGFVSSLEDRVIGFASWNPTGWPAAGIVGHNCILPEYQCRGYGRHQILEVLRRFAEAGFRMASVRTDEHPFFAPARRMYVTCGFEEVTRYPGELLDEYAMIEYERRLEPGACLAGC